MPRERAYIREDVLEAATRVFWEKGFAATSMNDLVTATGLNKHSMYREFGSKEGLFLECISHYVTKTNRDLMSILTEEPMGFSNIEKFFQNRIEYILSDRYLGCLLVNSAIEKETLSDCINEKSKYYLDRHEASFCRNLEAAKDRGEIPADRDAEFYAKYLFCFTQGMLVMGKTNPDRAMLERLVAEVLEKVRS